uniref:ABC transporter domain-containing protein n=1 Tax=Strigamia maritima TaxID=126957 RepID=T1IIG4_STRMM
MAFFKQLRLLCWKNFTLQRRQKKRLITEILWPLSLFLILMWVRTRELKLYFNECHYEQKAMPSAGSIPLLQTYLCSMNNTCHKQRIQVGEAIMNIYNNSLLTQFLFDFAQFTREQLTPDNKEIFQTLLKNIMKFDPKDIKEDPTKKEGILDIFTKPKQIAYLKNLFGANDTAGLTIKILKIQAVWSAAQKIIEKYQNEISNAPESNDTNKLTKKKPTLRDDRTKNPTACTEFLFTLFGNNTDVVQKFSNLLRPIIEGTILYHPDTPSTRKLMARVNQTFEGLVTLHSMIKDWLNDLSPRIKKLLSDNSSMTSLLQEFNSNVSKASVMVAISLIDDYAVIAEQFFKCFEFNKVQPSKSDSVVLAEKLNHQGKLWALVEFVDPDKYSDKLPKLIKYKIRMDAYRTDPTRTLNRPPPPQPRRSPLIHLKYLYFGFAFLQDMLDRAIIAEQSNKTISTGLWVQQFPFPCYITDNFIVAISGTFPMFVVLAWVYTSAMLIRSIVYEKEYRLKEMMRSMGLGNLVHWLSWFIQAFITILISLILLSLILKFGSILTFSDPTVTFVFLFCYAIATITLSFFLSTCFNNANLSAAVGGLIFFCVYLPYGFIVRWADYVGDTFRRVASLSSNIALGLGCTYIATLEEVGIGVQWSNIDGSTDMAEYYFTVADSIVMILLDAAIYFLLALYIEAVFPGTYGIPRPWYCCLEPLLCCFRRNKSNPDNIDEDDNTSVNNLGFETEPTHLNLGISVKHLRKVYSDGKVAVHDVNLNFYEGQITAFLGQNGAGKTTTISILTGLFPPTSGTAIINGFDIRTEMKEIRRTLGMCPQFNVLFEELTVYEHLWFYANLKHSDKTIEVSEEIHELITDVRLTEKTNVQAKKLSGGMLRKLSVAVAFIGGSKVVILDEPTAGVDPQARRAIWDLLVKYKKGRTILLTTHFMDEADILGDRIAIMFKGKIGCCGSSLFLKKRFGKGYYLTAIKKDPTDSTVASKMTNFISKFVPNVELKEDVGYELTFILPFDNVEKFKPLLDNLEKDKSGLGITEFGISDSKLEEIFLKVCESVEAIESDGVEDHETEHRSEVPELRKITGFALMFQQFKALSLKKLLNTSRNPKSIFSEIILPAIFICCAFIMTVIIPPITSYPPMELHLYQQPKENYIFFSEISNKSVLMESYVDSLVNMPHLGTRCITGEPLELLKCKGLKDNPSTLKAILSSIPNYEESCPCEKGVMYCPTESANYNFPTILLGTDDYLINITNINTDNWILRTHKKHYLNRQGGYTLGHHSPDTQVNWCDWLDIWLAVVNSSNDGSTHPCKLPVDRDHIKIWFNNRYSISVTAYLNAINNVILRASVNDRNDWKSYGIIAFNHPLSFTSEQAIDSIRDYGFFTLLQAVSIVFAMSFVPASFVLFLINERISKFKHLQLISGVTPILYWTVTYMITVMLCILIFLTFDDTGYTSNENFIPVVLLLVCYGLATIPLMYSFCFVFSVPSLAFVALSCCNLFVGIATTLSTYILELFQEDDPDLKHIFEILRQVFLIFPQYCLGHGLIDLKGHQQKVEVNKKFNTGYVSDDVPLQWDFVGRNIFFLLVVGVVTFAFTIMIEYRLFWKSSPHLKNNSLDVLRMNEDEDVAAERDKVLSGVYDNAVLRVENLEKVYDPTPWYTKITNCIRIKVFRKPPKDDNTSLRAVDRLSFGVNKGECFGLLGANGAGKTTTFKMLTGDVQCNGGDAYLLGYSIRREMPQVRKHLGYCPQFDALNGFLTCEEHLRLFAGLKGIHRDDVDMAVEWTVKILNFQSYLDIRAGKYSGGNKRKLCTAIAIIGNPAIIYLDEPTTGMDPKSRRFLWNCILNLIKSGQSVVLTSHSLEECEALCTRLAIMVTGRFKCFGTVQHLKNSLGGGYNLTIRVIDPENMDNVIKFIQENFPMVEIKDHHSNYAQFCFPQSDVILSDLFEQMENNKVQLRIADYSISQTTLDQVNNNFFSFLFFFFSFCIG